MTEKKKITLNMIMGIISFAITICISLFVTPYIVNTLGGEAYGFVGLSNNFVSYTSLIVIALNSMASRFVAVNIYEENWENANKYFTSVFFANCIIAAVLLPFIIVLVTYLEKFIKIPISLITDVKITFAIMFLQFILSIIFARYDIALFVKNKLYLTSLFSVISAAIRLLLIVVCFRVFGIHISFVVLGTLAGTIFTFIENYYYTKKLLPQMKVKLKYFDFNKIKEVVASGVWNLISKLSAVLLDGLDLLIANLFVGPVRMGALALSKTIPAMFMSLRGTLSYPFDPTIMKHYAKKDIDNMVKNIRLANKVENVFLIAPMAVFALFGLEFFKLWVPGEDAVLIQILSLLAILSLIASACINSVFSVFTYANKVKVPAIVTLFTGVMTTIMVFILVKFTNLGVYAIAGVSSVFSLLRNYIFTPIYGAICLKIKKRTFYKEIISGNICLIINLVIGFFIKGFLKADTWLNLIVSCILVGIVLVIINILIVLRREERKTLLNIIRRK